MLLPEGTEPIKALHSFRDNKTTLLLCTPAAARGLDLPAVRWGCSRRIAGLRAAGAVVHPVHRRAAGALSSDDD